MNIFKKQIQNITRLAGGVALTMVLSLMLFPVITVAQIDSTLPPVTGGTPGGQGPQIDLGTNPGDEWRWTNPTPVIEEPNPSQDRYSGTYCPENATYTFTNISSLFRFFTCLIQRLFLPLCFTMAILVFVWGTVQFMRASDSAEKEQGQQFMLWGVIGFAVMLSLWGIVNLFGVTFHTSNVVPTVPVMPAPSTK